MKKIITLLCILGYTSVSYSQALGYGDLALLFSNDDQNGSARFVAMGGAFGALGGDLSAVSINPAGLSVFATSAFSAGFNSRTTETMASYYGNGISTTNDFIKLSNAGAVFVFDQFKSSPWKKVAVGFNYRMLTDFEDSFFASGNSGFASFDTFPLDTNDPVTLYDVGLNQSFSNLYDGEINEFSLGIAAQHKDNIHIGAGINTYNLKFSQFAVLTESNSDGASNTLDANFYQENLTQGTGVSLSAGLIYNVNHTLRFGLSYQTPTWFTEIIEETNIVNNDGYFGDTEIIVSNDNTIYDNTANSFFPFQSIAYRLKTPSKFTLSSALVLGKTGLISVDYTRKGFKNMNLSGDDFTQENLFFSNQLRNTSIINIGTEWRFKRLSLRGGYSYEESPDANAISSDNLERLAIGVGYHFGGFTLDFAYSNASRTALYNFYPQYNQVNAADLAIDTQKFTATLNFKL